MKKTVLTFGLISGLISAALMSATVPFADKIGFDKGMYVGYTAMILAFTLVFFGIRSYRENVLDGYISFGKAFKVGILIALISSLCYVIAWEIVYFGGFMPYDFFEKYTAYLVDNLRQQGATQAQIAAEIQKMNDLKTLVNNPFFNALITFTEPLPVGIGVTLISALILRKRRKVEVDTPQLAAS